MKLLVKKGSTSKRVEVFIQDPTKTDGSGRSDLAYNSSGLTWYYSREDQGAVGGTSISPATMTRGTWASGGFVAKDSVNLPGVYQLGIPDAVLATGAGWAVMMLKGGQDVFGNVVMAPLTIEIQLVDYLPDETARAFEGLTTGAGTTTTMVASGLTQADTDYWKDCVVTVLSGPAAGQSRRISAFTPGADTLTVDTAFTTAPGTGALFAIANHVTVPAAGAGSSDWSSTEREYIRHRLGFDGTRTAPTATIHPSLGVLASGTADSGTTTTMVDAVRTEADTDYWKGMLIRFTSGNIAGQVRQITAFTPGSDTITFAPATTQAVTTQEYEILPQGAVDVRLWNGTAPNSLASGRVDADLGAWRGSVPNALVAARVDATVGAMQAAVLDAAAIAANAIASGKIGDNAIAASNFAADAISSNALAASAIAEIQSGLALSTQVDALEGAVIAILADTDDIQARLPAALVGGRMDSDVGAMQANVVTAAAIANAAIDAATLAADVSKYQAKILLVDDDTGAADRWLVAWFKNSEPIYAGVTVPTIQVVKAADGTDLVPAATALTQIGATGWYRYNAAGAERVVDGAGYVAKVTATIDGSSRTWSQPVGRDA